MSTNKLYVAFLWHMHQPMYKDPTSGRYILPWVRLHSTKGYNDMLSILEGFPNVRQTFNVVPSLMKQMEDYVTGTATDDFLELSRKPADDLTNDERVFILWNFFAANWDTMVAPYPRYKELLEKRGRRTSYVELQDRQSAFSVTDMRDLQAWFNLTWFGYAAREKDPELQRLLQRRRGFSEDEKQLVLDKQMLLLRSLPQRYRQAQESGQIEISVSPFYHPILPLLCDMESAREALPHIRLPKEPFRYPQDARRQVADAIAYYERVFGRKPRGMWPSEGSVSTEAAGIMGEAGIRWIASDEEILLHTLKRKRLAELIYTPYALQFDGIHMNIVFRDRQLSDLIGFTYSKNDPDIAARDMVNHLRNIRSALNPKAGENLVSIILDGENAWEYYPDGGRQFLSRLYSLISASSEIEATTIGDYLEQHPPSTNLHQIFSGSWISHNFNIWIGRREDNMAWDALARTRRHLEQQQRNRSDIPAETWESAWDAIYTAEGSDWFWWYGDDFNSSFDSEFDRLFRSNLIQVYKLLGDPVPSFLTEPIVNIGAARPTEQPTSFIKPIIDGLITHFYEWVGAGSFDVRRSGGAMNISETAVSCIYWGFDLNTLFLRIDTGISPLDADFADTQIIIHIDATKRFRLKPIFSPIPNERKYLLIHENTGDDEWIAIGEDDRVSAEKVIECAVDFERLSITPGDEARLYITVHKKQLEIERWPRNGYLEFHAPGKDFEAEQWFV